MDFRGIVGRKLLGDDQCICCLLVALKSEDGERTPAVIALVESKGEHSVFLYHCLQVPSSRPEHLELDQVLPIDLDFKYSINQGSSHLRLRTADVDIAAELPNENTARDFLGELKATTQVYSQNAGFGITSHFVWINKYTKKELAAGTEPLSEVVDPMSDGWPFSQILQTRVGRHCPVVTDSHPMEHSASTPDLHAQTKHSTSLSDTASFHSGLNNQQSEFDQSLHRSYDRSMDHLDEVDAVVTGESVVNRRDQLIKHLMKQREEEYIEIQTYRIFCGTWNTNGQSASSSIRAWLSPQEDTEPPDLYVIGFQELDLSKNAYIFSESPKEEEWYKRVREALHPKATYKKVKLIRLVGIMLVIFVKVELSKNIYNLMWDTVGTGILGMMGNKGGVGVRFSFHDTSICVINSHLAAHMEEYERRNQDFRDISSRMVFGKTKEKGEYFISDHDMVFWIGDLNYRLSDIDIDRVKKLIESAKFTELMNYDQLCRQIALKRVFLDYVEGRVSFIPTYKYDPGTDNWDTSEKCRVPAWCDRILWRGHNVRQMKYRSHMACQISDHKPVSAVFDVGIKVINQKQYRLVYEDLMKHLDRVENEFLPQVVLSTTDVHFKDVKFIELQKQTITVTNTGQGPVQFEFINKPKEVSFCKKWLHVDPCKGIVDVGQQLEMSLEIYVESPAVAALNVAEDSLDDIVVLHLLGGKDLFITVTGTYIPSCFGTSLENLVNMFPPMRSVPPEQIAQLARRGQVSSDRPLDIPKEIYWLVDHLYKFGLKQEYLFQQPGRHSEVQGIRDCLDQGIPTDIVGHVHSVAEAFLIFLEALPESVIPTSNYNKCLEASGSFSSCKQVLSQIPLCHRNVFKYICAFLRELLEHLADNGLDIRSLGRLFGGLLLRSASPPPPAQAQAEHDQRTGRKTNREEEERRSAFVQHFLLNEYDG